MVLSLAGIALLGLCQVYVVGYDSWEKTSVKIRLQQNGTLALAQMTQALQAAQSIVIRDQGFSVLGPAADSVVEFNRSGYELWQNQKRIIPFEGWDKQLRVENLEVRKDPVTGIIHLRLELASDIHQIQERLNFQTSVYLRNEPTLADGES